MLLWLRKICILCDCNPIFSWNQLLVVTSYYGIPNVSVYTKLWFMIDNLNIGIINCISTGIETTRIPPWLVILVYKSILYTYFISNYWSIHALIRWFVYDWYFVKFVGNYLSLFHFFSFKFLIRSLCKISA